MGWIADNWGLLVTALVAVYGAVLSTVNLILGRREKEERVDLGHPFWTNPPVDDPRGAFLRVEVVNIGQRPLYIKAVKLHASGIGHALTFESMEPAVSKNPLQPGERRIYQRAQPDVAGFIESLKGAWITVESNRGEIARREIEPAQLVGGSR